MVFRTGTIAAISVTALALGCSCAAMAQEEPSLAPTVQQLKAMKPETQRVKAPILPLVLINQVGYAVNGPKVAIAQLVGTKGDLTSFEVRDVHSGKVVLRGTPKHAGKVDSWRNWNYWTINFSSVNKPGRYEVCVAGTVSVCSFPARVATHLLKRYTISNVIYYFKSQRDSGVFEQADRHLKNPNPAGPPYVDLHGGWYDATGDYGIHLSQPLETMKFLNQQSSIVTWAAIEAFRNLRATGNLNYAQYERRLLDAATYGADTYVRWHVPGMSFYESITQPGVEKLARNRKVSVLGGYAFGFKKGSPHWPKDYLASFNTGGGLVIAGLAAASTLPEHGEYSNARYLKAAEDAFKYLSAHDADTWKGGPTIAQAYGALMASTEIYRATKSQEWLKVATHWARTLTSYLKASTEFGSYWVGDETGVPFFNGTDDGLPTVALLNFASVATGQAKAAALKAAKSSLDGELKRTGSVTNPFGYAREVVQLANGKRVARFFYPPGFTAFDGVKKSWYQGADAAIESWAAAARMAIPFFGASKSFQVQLKHFAWDQLNWVLGRNPYNTSMLMGSGYLNANYRFFNSWEYTSAPGGIINGITAGYGNLEDHGIEFDLGYKQTHVDDEWRWTEQWLPHDAWYLIAASLPQG